jgi:phosphoglycolate phosphatase-like HAD superfamily hydrolase
MNQRYHTFIALDSDGCVVDTMDAKQHGFLQPLMVKHLGLNDAQAAVYKACADYVNLYSVTRGISRFKAILLNFEHYNAHPTTRASQWPLLPTDELRDFVESGLPLGNPALQSWLETHPSKALETLLAWSLDVNETIVSSGATFPAYEGARTALKRMKGRSHNGIVSQSPEPVLREDWGRQGLLDDIEQIAGQEKGLKVAQLTLLTEGIARHNVMMIGDAPGDLEAARAFGCRFFPILPGKEEASWEIFNTRVYDAFLNGTSTAEEEASYIEAFEQTLPSTPPWEHC